MAFGYNDLLNIYMATTTSKSKTATKVPSKKVAKKPVKKVADEFAVIATGGKQYSVSIGDIVMIEKFKDELKKGEPVTFTKVLLVYNGTDTTIGTPFIDGAQVDGVVEVVGRAPKVTVIKYKQKSRYFKKNGHRQPYLKIKITSIK